MADELLVESNGTGTVPEMTLVTETLRHAVESARQRHDQLTEELTQAKHELSRFEKALALIEDRPPTPKVKKSTAVRPIPSKVSPERVAEYVTAIEGWVGLHGDVKFRQVDIRERMGQAADKSGVSSLVFTQLRDDNVIRVAGREGNNKYYRVTQQTLDRLSSAEPVE